MMGVGNARSDIETRLEQAEVDRRMSTVMDEASFGVYWRTLWTSQTKLGKPTRGGSCSEAVG